MSLELDAIPICQWARFPQEPQDLYVIGPDLKKGADYAFAAVPAVRVIDISGFAAAEFQRLDTPPDRHCQLGIDVAAGQTLVIRYDYDGAAVPMTSTLACDKARTVAELAVQTLTDRVGG